LEGHASDFFRGEGGEANEWKMENQKEEEWEKNEKQRPRRNEIDAKTWAFGSMNRQRKARKR
jgi:hypothetical protein